MLSNFDLEKMPLVWLKHSSITHAPIGWFSKARGLGQRSRLLSMPIAQVLFPITAADEHGATNRTDLLCRNSLALMAVAVAALCVVIRPTIILLYGKEFLACADVFRALGLGLVVWPIAHFLGVHIAARGSPKKVFLASLLPLLLAPVACGTLISWYGAVGAGMAVTILYTVRLLALIVVYVRTTDSSVADVLCPRLADVAEYKRVLLNLWRMR